VTATAGAPSGAPPALGLAAAAAHTVADELATAGLRIDSCILGSVACVEVLRYHGQPAKPVEVWAMACDAAAWDHIAAGGAPDRLPAESWTVAIDLSSADPHRFSGHVVVEAAGWWVDPTAAQFDRPARGIHVPGPVVVAVPGAGEVAVRLLDGGGALVYAATRQTGRWRAAPDAGGNGLARSVAAAAIRRARSNTRPDT
jgi:hypothetical protein